MEDGAADTKFYNTNPSDAENSGGKLEMFEEEKG